jgi:hypothetical protein
MKQPAKRARIGLPIGARNVDAASTNGAKYAPENYPNGRRYRSEAGKNPSGSLSFSHHPLTTADAKIPLSVVQVKPEPQYVVFSCACTAPTWATPAFRCAKQEKAISVASFPRGK